jgi:hypothetical protein
MRQWLRFLRGLPECADLHEVHLIIDGYAAHVCDDVQAMEDGGGICLHLIPPGLTDLLQPLPRAVRGALKAEYRAIYLYEMSQREDTSMAKANFAAYRLLAGELVSEDAIHRDWQCYRPDTEVLERELGAAPDE